MDSLLSARSLLGLLLLGVGACEGTSAPPVTVMDSAGVRLTITADQPMMFGEVDPQPALTLGGADTSGPTEFFQIRNVLIGPGGRLWVADGQSAEIRIFLDDGSHLRTVGGRGEGPGEFLQLRLLGFFRGDSAAAWDNGTGRLTVFDAEGEMARTQRIVPAEGPSVSAAAVFRDGSLLAQVPRVLMAGSLEPDRILGDSARLVRVNPRDSTQQLVAVAPGPLWLWTGRSQVPIPFTLNASFGVLGEGVHLVAGSEFRVRVFEGGGLSAIYGVDREPRRVSQSDVGAYRDMVDEYIPEPTRAEYLSALGRAEVPAVLPAYSALIVSSDGRIWCRIYSAEVTGPGTWDVFGKEGRWLGQVRTPPGLTVMSIDPPRLAGVWRDEMGVEYVRVHRIGAR